MIFALDTNIVIRYLRNEPNVIHNFRSAFAANHHIIIPQAVDYEICRGFRLVTATRKKANYDMLLQNCKIAEMDVLSWKRAEEIYENLYRKGFTVGELDMLIAAYCVTHGCTVVTNNIKDFENIDGLIMVDWTKP
ncbi:MAG: PIN domain-containing protein [Defluviitaleaceae bacterium]|nr:PIN domain-containing protein [Defluviitaleaceae bacterium]